LLDAAKTGSLANNQQQLAEEIETADARIKELEQTWEEKLQD